MKTKEDLKPKSENRLLKLLILMIAIFGGVVIVPLIPQYYFWGEDIYKARKGERDYEFDGTISREVLESYLSRAITYLDLLNKNYLEGRAKGNVNDAIRFIINIGAKFIGRTIYRWNGESTFLSILSEAEQIAEQIHSIDPEIILQAAVFETISKQVESIQIPSWVFEEFKLPVENRNFVFDNMYDVGGSYDDFWGKDTAVPDITKLETKMWVFFLSSMYIDIGIEAIHFGQVHLTGFNDPFFIHWQEVLQRVRGYAETHARRHMLICDAHTHGIVINGQLLLDFHSSPLRTEEVKEKPLEVELKTDSLRFYDNIYKKSKGGIAPSGWACDSLPYIVEFDNYGVSDSPGEYTADIWTWGYDEISWYAQQPEEYRNQFLLYVIEWLEDNDPNGFLQMPGSRVLAAANDGSYYFANTKSTSMPYGYNQEETIKKIWEEMPEFYIK